MKIKSTLEHRREIVYYVEVDTKKTQRNKKLGDILGEHVDIFYIGEGSRVGQIETIDRNKARFWKDKFAAEKAASLYADLIPTVREMNIEDFVNDIDPPDIDNYVCKRTRRMIESESRYLIEKKEFLKIYDCGSDYKIPPRWTKWRKCPNCDKRPIIKEFTHRDGSQTACGCTKDSGEKFSVYAGQRITLDRWGKYKTEELLSNWNHWVKTGQHLVGKIY